jgi:hypothetical protein
VECTKTSVQRGQPVYRVDAGSESITDRVGRFQYLHRDFSGMSVRQSMVFLHSVCCSIELARGLRRDQPPCLPDMEPDSPAFPRE